MLLQFESYHEAESMSGLGMLQAPQEVMDCPSPKWAS